MALSSHILRGPWFRVFAFCYKASFIERKHAWYFRWLCSKQLLYSMFIKIPSFWLMSLSTIVFYSDGRKGWHPRKGEMQLCLQCYCLLLITANKWIYLFLETPMTWDIEQAWFLIIHYLWSGVRTREKHRGRVCLIILLLRLCYHLPTHVLHSSPILRSGLSGRPVLNKTMLLHSKSQKS